MLNLNPLIIESLRLKKIQYSHAIQLNKIKDEIVLKEIIEETIKYNLSKDELIERIKKLIDSEIKIDVFSDFNKKLKEIKKLPKDKFNLVQDKIREILEIIGQDSK